MKVGMKNLVWSEDAANLGTLASNFDFAINEECYDYEECGVSACVCSDRFHSPIHPSSSPYRG